MTDKIYVQIDDKKIELTGEALEAFLADRAIIESTRAIAEAEKAKAEIAKAALLERLGITADEAKLLLS
jgi:carboxylesterase type B